MILRTCDVGEFILRAEGKEIVCWGAGGWLSVLTDRFGLGIEKTYSYIVDSSPELHGTTRIINGQELTVRSPQYLHENVKPNTIILITVEKWEEVYSLIRSNPLFSDTECYPATIISRNQIDKLTYSVDSIPNDFRMNKVQQIPKIIHYIWFGSNQMPDKYKIYMDSWHKFCPDYEIKKWDESNYDVYSHPFMKGTMEIGRPGLTADFARLDIVYRHGGIYLDVDVEIVKNVDELLYNNGFCGFSSYELVGLGLGFGAVQGHPMIKKLLDQYDSIPRDATYASGCPIAAPVYQTKTFKECGLKLDGSFQVVEGMAVYPSLYFDPISHHGTNRLFKTEETYTIHHYFASWLSYDELSKYSGIRDSMSDVLDSEARIQGANTVIDFLNMPDFALLQHNMQVITAESLNPSITGDDSIVIYGAGFYGIKTLITLRKYGVNPTFIVDRNSEYSGSSIGGIPIMGLEALSTISNDTMIIITPRYASAGIEKMLRSYGFNNLAIEGGIVSDHNVIFGYSKNCELKQQIFADSMHKVDFVKARLADAHSVKVFEAIAKLWCHGDYQDCLNLVNDEGYYPDDIIKLNDDEVFVDCGAYIGDSVEKFALKTHGKYKAIYAYEASELQYEQAKAYLRAKKIENLELHNIGVWSSEGELCFDSTGDVGNRISNGGETKIKVNSLDNLLKDKLSPTFIKMDIEGAELEALKGSMEVIKEHLPKLAISVYHKFGDIWEIPYYILNETDRYKIYLRANSPLYDFIFFAIPK